MRSLLMRRRPDLRTRLAQLTATNRSAPSRERERELLALRHQIGIELLDGAPADPSFAAPSFERLPDGLAPLPELAPTSLDAGVLRAGILRHGCVLVRGLVPRERALDLAAAIDRAHLDRETGSDGGSYEEFEPDPRFGGVAWRAWIKEGGGLLAADSPPLMFAMMELFAGAGLPRLVSDYLGEPPLISVHKTTLRRAEPSVSGAWHQDGFFMGPVRALNLWLSLSDCGRDAPGLDIVPRRLSGYAATGTEGAALEWTVSDEQAHEAAAAGGTTVIRPIFAPGDALLFDELFLHKTGSDPSMPHPRYAIENWFFGGSSFPKDYAPLAV